MRPIENIHNLVHRFTGNRASFQFEDIVTVSDNVLETIRLAAQAAGSMSNVLLERKQDWPRGFCPGYP